MKLYVNETSAYLGIPSSSLIKHVEAYSELPTPPQPFNDSQLVERHGGKQDLGAVSIAHLPC